MRVVCPLYSAEGERGGGCMEFTFRVEVEAETTAKKCTPVRT